MKEFIKKFLIFFLIINTGITIIFAIFAGNAGSIDVVSLWRIMLIAALTALVTAVVFSIEPKKHLTVPMIVLIFFCHFFVLSLIVYVGGTWFGWFERSLSGLLSVILSVGFVYIFTTVATVILTHKETNELNEALKDYKEE